MELEARKRIDNARNVLVGKIPDPKAQVEQITTALIYKFMDDMDKKAQRLGGKASFLTNGYEKYAWTHILDPRLGGQERLNLYVEALSTMSQNPHLPQLFRTIFKDAFLPYRDPTTLNLFLKVINGFTYDHSENLGDAYEYLLSILGSQGDAGQFRTPRHIIDFMVRAVDPKKNETMLDPASGTAGFLISSYRHIIEQNQGHQLTPDEKERLAGNLQGYDISPDMVRIGLVNMYLHNFPNPRIYEYDTLASEEHWHEKFDICMANPPFMTPTGGVRPHKLFQIPANRSEVLFVDYIAEHLKPTGRAAVIVPEGIVFASDNAYKKLRKMLVETWGLWAVVSLPAGLFQPYSGVKTSILFLNKVFAKKTDEIVFVKVQNDGFSLGSQRHPVDQNDLPAAQEILQAWQRNERQETPLAQWVDKAAIAESGDYNLTGERYREVIVVNTTWPMVQLEQLCTEMKSGFAFGKYVRDESGIPHLRPMNVTTNGQLSMDDVKRIPRGAEGKFEEFALRKGDVLFNNTNSKELVGKTCYIGIDLGYYFSNHMTRLRTRPDLDPAFLARILHSMWQRGDFLALCNKWVGQAAINNHALSALRIPLPRLDVQQQIVGELDGYQCIIDSAKQVIANWKPTFDIGPSWPSVRLDEVCCLSGQYGSGARKVAWDGEVRYVRITDLDNSGNLKTDDIVSPSKIEPELFLHQGDLLFARSGSVGRVYLHRLATGKHQFAGYLVRYSVDPSKTLPEYIFYLTKSRFWDAWVTRQSKTATLTNINAQQFSSFELPLPPLDVQRNIVAEIEKEEQAVESCKNLVSAYEAKIRATIARLWGDRPNG